ncbi:exopolysaccharide biosynthesis polyprenyl glycosylphosphotransferase [Myceligenerans xiligouense]|uniref:Exopolysaccharide biosynthesis polyprenyl glycosylphosphotransferase n=1 Tax=Myceligenerans xiligouense TaxID=253184 RepID=A0A3N4YIB5_9MICO|nr:exopolysaccharide biosynthesis polyprenyl glycosylphosphotransferase [Myceligenerans xiligouense]
MISGWIVTIDRNAVPVTDPYRETDALEEQFSGPSARTEDRDAFRIDIPRPRRGAAARWQDDLNTQALVYDLIAVSLGVGLGYFLRFDRAVEVELLEPRGGLYVLLSVVLVEGWVLALGLAGSRRPEVIGSGREEYLRAIRGTLGMFGLLAVVCFLAKFDLARSYVAVTLPVGLALLLLGRWLLQRRLHERRRRGECRRRTVLVGSRAAVGDLGRRIERASGAGFEVVGVCVRGGVGSASPVEGVPVLGSVEQAADVAARVDADAVAVTAHEDATPAALKQLAWDLEPTGAKLVVVPGLADVAAPRLVITPVDGTPMVQVTHPGYTGLQHVAKRAFDVAGATVILAVTLVPLVVCAVLVRLTSRGPALFRQQRIGLNGEPFTMYKLRSMRLGSEARLSEALGAEAGVFYKPRNDPRVTRVGRFLRKYSIDEFPQLINVLKGDMSLVGPRPQVADEVRQYDDTWKRRLYVKPGLTGLWQVSGRNDLPVDQSVRLDLYYVENWSLLGDVAIILRTAREVFMPSGAY